jgi:GT2 family glycosyltransferase
MARVSVVVVTYNARAHVDECLRSLAHQTFRDLEVVLVDNGSSDGTFEHVRAGYPFVRCVRADRNRGYAGGINVGVRSCRGEFVAVLNPDTSAEPTWLERLVEVMTQHPEVGAVTSRLVLYHDRARLNALGIRIHVTGLAFNEGLGRPNPAGRCAPFAVSGVHGGAFLVRKAILDQIGGLNEDTFMYYEEVDLSWMLHLLGWQIWCVPDSVVYHKYTLKMSPEKFFWLERNRLALLWVVLEPGTALRLGASLLVTEAFTWSYALLRGREFVGAKVRAWHWVVRQRARLADRRRRVQAMRRVPDREILPRLSRAYAWDQLRSLLHAPAHVTGPTA